MNEHILIDNYLNVNKLNGNKIILNKNYNLKLLPDNIVFCHILCIDYTIIEFIMDNLKSKLKNGAILLFDNWFYNINVIDKNIKDIVEKWKINNNLELFELNFNNINLFSKAFIYRNNPNKYYNWSD